MNEQYAAMPDPTVLMALVVGLVLIALAYGVKALVSKALHARQSSVLAASQRLDGPLGRRMTVGASERH